VGASRSRSVERRIGTHRVHIVAHDCENLGTEKIEVNFKGGVLTVEVARSGEAESRSR
jgi:HSP20 family molecular chaperone IbpA